MSDSCNNLNVHVSLENVPLPFFDAKYNLVHDNNRRRIIQKIWDKYYKSDFFYRRICIYTYIHGRDRSLHRQIFSRFFFKGETWPDVISNRRATLTNCYPCRENGTHYSSSDKRLPSCTYPLLLLLPRWFYVQGVSCEVDKAWEDNSWRDFKQIFPLRKFSFRLRSRVIEEKHWPITAHVTCLLRPIQRRDAIRALWLASIFLCFTRNHSEESSINSCHNSIRNINYIYCNYYLNLK